MSSMYHNLLFQGLLELKDINQLLLPLIIVFLSHFIDYANHFIVPILSRILEILTVSLYFMIIRVKL